MTKSSSNASRTSRTTLGGFQWTQYETLENLSDFVVHSMGTTESEATGPKPTDLAWAAGLLDGEGCFSLTNTPYITVESITPGVITEMNRIFGGNCVALKRKTSRGNVVFRWRIYGQNALNVCRSTAQYLVDKKEQAHLLTRALYYPSNSAMRTALKRRISSLKRLQ